MTPTAASPEAIPPRRYHATTILTAVLLAGVAAVLLTGSGCSRPPTPPPDDTANAALGGDPWEAAGSRLKKQTDLAATKSVLATLTSDIGAHGQKLPAISDAEVDALAKVVPLSAADREEIRGSAYSSHDPVYLADCFYLRDAARSLGVAGLPPEKQAELAFAWVCRQVYLQPWLLDVGGGHYQSTALPPTTVLRRGFGSGLERMYVFLALLQQLELDACLIGGPDSGNGQSRLGPALNYPHITQVRVQRGPFWAVGVRVGNDVRLFDPWRGEPFPVTLNELKVKPEAAKAWFEDKSNISQATVEDAKKATIYLAVPVNSLSPRMAMFESKLKGELGVKVAFDLRSLEAKRAAFGESRPAYWNPPDDPFAYGRVSRSFLPLDMGGSDRGPRGSRLYDLAVYGPIQRNAVRLNENLTGIAADRVANYATQMFVTAFVDSPNPRERIQRGEFQEAARDIVVKLETFSQGLERLRTQDTAQQQAALRDWIEAMNNLFQELKRAELNMNKEQQATIIAQMDNYLQQPAARLLIDQASAEVGRAEAALLLALCKHEQAESIQVRLERATGSEAERLKLDARDAWKTAASAWRAYEQYSSAHSGFPGRTAHARTLSSRAASFVGAKQK